MTQRAQRTQAGCVEGIGTSAQLGFILTRVHLYERTSTTLVASGGHGHGHGLQEKEDTSYRSFPIPQPCLFISHAIQ